MPKRSAPAVDPFPLLGCESAESHDDSLTLRHGTSLSLMSLCSAFLNSSSEFNRVDPERDWKKWTKRAPEAFTLYYAALVDSTDPSVNGVQCVIRAVLDKWYDLDSSRARLVIDYVACRESSRRRGLASTLVRFVTESSALRGADLYVLAIEDSCPWWMDRGFALVQSAHLNARLRVFSDVHLLSKGEPTKRKAKALRRGSTRGLPKP